MRQGLWGIVSGRSKRPIPAESKATTAAETALIDAWDKNAEKAAGELYLLVSEEQKVHFAGITDDPCKMWAQLESVHLQRRPGARFNAYDALFLRHIEALFPYYISSTHIFFLSPLAEFLFSILDSWLMPWLISRRLGAY